MSNGKKVLLGTLIAFFFAVGVFLFAFVQVGTHAAKAVAALEMAKTDAMALRFDSADQELQTAQASFRSAKTYAPVLKIGALLPWIGPTLAQSDTLISAGLDVSVALQSVSKIGQDVLRLSGLNEVYFKEVQAGTNPRVSFTDLSPETKQMVLNRLATASSQFSLLSNRLSIIHDELNGLSQNIAGSPYVSMVDSANAQLVIMQQTLREASLLTDVVPVFAGVGKPAHHLILLLNNTELRPGGGFVGTYGIATVSNGDIQSVKTSDVYALDRLVEGKESEAAPFALAAYNQTPILYFRDANWSPDFAVSAQKMIQKYQQETALLPEAVRSALPYADSIDGVVAFTPDVVSRLLKLMGPITVAGQTFTSENITDKLEYLVEKAYAVKGIPEAQRKEVIGDLMDVMNKKLMNLPLSDWGEVLTILDSSFTNRQLFLFHTQPTTEAVITRAGWSGTYAVHTPDVQLVVDANLASLKTDPVVDRSIKYEITKGTKGERIGRTTIIYTHTGSFNWKTSRYRTYTRLYVPEGSTLLRVSGSMKNDLSQNPTAEAGVADVSTELGMTVFGAFISIEPGKTGTLTFEYTLANSVRSAIAKNTYALTVFKQNGARNHALTLDLDFGKNVQKAAPPEKSSEWGDSHYKLNTILDQDKQVSVGL